MLSRLSTTLETLFKRTDRSINDENRRVGLRCAGDHVGDEIAMTWRVDESEPAGGGLE